MKTSDPPLLEARHIVKTYGHVEALRGAEFAIWPGEVVGLMGDNGAGKSTLVKILSGVVAPDSGEIRFEGKGVSLNSPEAARALGIETVYQDLALADTLDPAANLFLGRELLRPGFLGRFGFLDKRRMRREAADAFKRLAVPVSAQHRSLGGMSGGQRQGVAVSRAVMWASRVIFMDEPTAALGLAQTQNVQDLIRRVRDEGIAVVLISHSIPEVLAVTDRIQVMNLGRRVATFKSSEASSEAITAAITGATVGADCVLTEGSQP